MEVPTDMSMMETLAARGSWPLVLLDDLNHPVSAARGLVAEYQENYYLVTAAHAVGNFGRWGIQLDYEEGKGVLVAPIPPMTFWSILDLTKIPMEDALELLKKGYRWDDQDIEGVSRPDIAIGKFERLPNCHEIMVGRDGINRFKKTAIIIRFGVKLEEEKTYSLFGTANHGIDPARPGVVVSELVYRDNLKYLNSSGTYELFSQEEAHQIAGCSGAPIFDDDGECGCILIGGDERDARRLVGIHLDHIRAILEVWAI